MLKRRLKKRTITLWAILVVLGFCSPVMAEFLSFNPASQQINPGTETDVDIVISGLDSTDLATFVLDITYDADILQFDKYTLGTALGDFGSGEALDESLGGDGTISLSVFSWIEDDTFWASQPDSFVLATLSFTGIQTGTSPLSFSYVDLGDLLGDSISADLTTGDIEVTTVPIPRTAYLFAGSLIVLVGARKIFPATT